MFGNLENGLEKGGKLGNDIGEERIPSNSNRSEDRTNLIKTVLSFAVASLLLVAIPGSAIGPFVDEQIDKMSLVSSYEAFEMWRSEQARTRSSPLDDERILQKGSIGHPESAFPPISDEGRPLGNDPPHQHRDILMEKLISPPYNTGGGYSLKTDSLGEYQVGVTHEYRIGDQNGNGILEYVVYHFYRPNSINGIDDDGDGCVDELTHWQWDPSRGTGCDLLPDAMIYFETGVDVFLGGSRGDLAFVVDFFGYEPHLEVFKIGVTPRFMAYTLRGTFYHAQVAGDYLSYYSYESINGINANPEMDNDYSDYYVGSIDLRGFPTRSPVDHACSAGMLSDSGAIFQRDDGWVVTSYELWESFDDHDWNGDGDISDYVSAYYSVGPFSGNCRENAVNTAVYGRYPKNSGTLLLPKFTFERDDNRDWNRNGDVRGCKQLYHDIDSTWHLKGMVYTSDTFTAPVPRWGMGWWAVYDDCYSYTTYPLKFGGASYRYLGLPLYYLTHFFTVLDEDGNRHTALPIHYVSSGRTWGTLGGRCMLIEVREHLLPRNPFPPGPPPDGNGDGDLMDTLYAVYCPKAVGGQGSWATTGNGVIDGLGNLMGVGFTGYVRHRRSDYIVEDSNGQVALPFVNHEVYSWMDFDGDVKITYAWVHFSYLLRIPR